VFDVSFSELMVIAVVALLVIGPEKLPKVARTVGAFMGRMQRFMTQVKEEVNREVRFEELQKLQQEIKQSVEQKALDIETETAVLGAALQPSIHAPSRHAEMQENTDEIVVNQPPKPIAAPQKRVSNRAQSNSTAKPAKAKKSTADTNLLAQDAAPESQPKKRIAKKNISTEGASESQASLPLNDPN
jgi:sec-independent protein translocase protein TatB